LKSRKKLDAQNLAPTAAHLDPSLEEPKMRLNRKNHRFRQSIFRRQRRAILDRRGRRPGARGAQGSGERFAARANEEGPSPVLTRAAPWWARLVIDPDCERPRTALAAALLRALERALFNPKHELHRQTFGYYDRELASERPGTRRADRGQHARAAIANER
jgi:hypothetical protein